ncbi:serine/threonine protein kinase [Piscibacillus halophilus]|uniref:Serine/threonine protein kinase n=1 Tax=Piscibacillus halophilus TaxID=571933 RepID=A0A1H9LZW0_9BACI|nr:protein kinase [Piscibacillus halophilus]SER16323.1 serine/threonine protein kinase [Piscibacillus halophilus]
MTSSIHPTVRLNKHQQLKGIWNKRTYVIIRLIGEGARGSIYLALLGNRYVALKISQDSSVITAEVNVLKMLKKVQGQPLGPLLLDVDDAYVSQSSKLAFYVMEYIDGVPLGQWIEREGLSWMFPISFQLLSQLNQLHQLGYIYGDLKPDNILIDKRTKHARLIDVGGVTAFNRSIREYTTWYDRGYWKMGDRRAEPTYDLFAYAVCLLNMDPHVKIQKSSERDILKLLNQAKSLKPIHHVLNHAFHGKYQSALEMKKDLEHINAQQMKKPQSNYNTPSPKLNVWPETIGISSIIFIHVALFYYFIL